MPKVDQATKEGRKERVFLTLRRYAAGLSEADLEQIMGIERRTLNNYLRQLEQEGKVYKEEKSIHWVALPYDQVQLRKFELSPEEAMTLYLATRLLVKQQDKRNEAAETVLMKLAAVLTADVGVGNEIHQAATELAQRPDDGDYYRLFRTLMQAYIFRRVVHITYEPATGNVFETDFSPYLIEPSAIGFTTYVIGYSSLVDARRTYKLERIRSATLTRQEYHIPPDFPGLDILRSAWSIIWGEELTPVTLRFSPAVKKRVLETHWHPLQGDPIPDPDKPDYLIWKANVADTLDMLPWIRGWGADVEVLEPKELRDSIQAEIRRMNRRYNLNTSNSSAPTARLLRLWGKTPLHSRKPDEFHPALFHMLDVGHIARELLSNRATRRWRRILGTALDAEPDTLADWLPWMIALHDIGKLSVPFQAQNEAQQARLKAEGFSFKGWRGGNEPHHTFVGQVFIKNELDKMSLSSALRDAWLDMLGGHHGTFVAPSSWRDAQSKLQLEPQPEWTNWRKLAAETLKDHFLNASLDSWPEPTNISAASMALTGFTILCDWLGSDSTHFPIQPEATLEEYIPESVRRAREAVERAGFFQLYRSSSPTQFALLFPEKPPRPLQLAIDAIPADILTKPCLAIIEAPTGEGKTEAALALAHRLAQVSGTNELYYALPTAATSNQMFLRLQSHLRDGLGLPTQARLIHSQAFLVEDDLRVELLSNGDSEISPASEWFGPKKRALLAPFGVGTIDQAELAALNVRHNALRMIGLAGKVVIVDEVHAYDTYMTTIVERLLNWLAALGTSVILLSATLPKGRRATLAHAYGVEINSELGSASAYPSLWVIGSAGQYQDEPSAYQLERRLQVEVLNQSEEDYEAKARWLVQAVAEGGCACWITNTVERAQKIFDWVDRLVPKDVDRTLLHARLPLDERQKREDELRAKYGPDGKRPLKGIVVGTQVLEQSLDLDFDVMASDLAPIDLLLQRAGRLQRHDRIRPAFYAEPCLWISVELDIEGSLKLSVDTYIYAEFILRQTWITLAGRNLLTLPADYRPLIESVYGGNAPESDSLLADAWEKLQAQESNATGKANQRLTPEPDPEDSFSGPAAQLTFEENENGAAWVVAQTRLGEESLTLIPLEKNGETAWFETHGERTEVSLDAAAPREIQLSLLRRSLRVSAIDVVQALKHQPEPLPSLFTKSPLLKDCYPLWLANGRTILISGKTTLVLTLDPRLGLVIERQKGV